jgi:hypothetical protein
MIFDPLTVYFAPDEPYAGMSVEAGAEATGEATGATESAPVAPDTGAAPFHTYDAGDGSEPMTFKDVNDLNKYLKTGTMRSAQFTKSMSAHREATAQLTRDKQAHRMGVNTLAGERQEWDSLNARFKSLPESIRRQIAGQAKRGPSADDVTSQAEAMMDEKLAPLLEAQGRREEADRQREYETVITDRLEHHRGLNPGLDVQGVRDALNDMVSMDAKDLPSHLIDLLAGGHAPNANGSIRTAQEIVNLSAPPSSTRGGTGSGTGARKILSDAEAKKAARGMFKLPEEG